MASLDIQTETEKQGGDNEVTEEIAEEDVTIDD